MAFMLLQGIYFRDQQLSVQFFAHLSYYLCTFGLLVNVNRSGLSPLISHMDEVFSVTVTLCRPAVCENPRRTPDSEMLETPHLGATITPDARKLRYCAC